MELSVRINKITNKQLFPLGMRVCVRVRINICDLGESLLVGRFPVGYLRLLLSCVSLSLQRLMNSWRLCCFPSGGVSCKRGFVSHEKEFPFYTGKRNNLPNTLGICH